MFFVLHLGSAPVSCSITVYLCVLSWLLLLQLCAGPPPCKKRSDKGLNQLIWFSKFRNCSIRLHSCERN